MSSVPRRPENEEDFSGRRHGTAGGVEGLCVCDKGARSLVCVACDLGLHLPGGPVVAATREYTQRLGHVSRRPRTYIRAYTPPWHTLT